jgi:hypothetical protein
VVPICWSKPIWIVLLFWRTISSEWVNYFIYVKMLLKDGHPIVCLRFHKYVLSPYGHIYDLLTGLSIKLIVGSMFMMLSRLRNDKYHPCKS